MPIARFQMPDGRIGRFDVPEGTSPEEAQSHIEQMIQSQQAPVPQTPQSSGNIPGQQNPDVPMPGDEAVQGVWGRLIRQESGGNQAAVSPKGAIGRAQIMPATAPEAAQLAGLPFDEQAYRTDPQYNEALGQAYLRKQFQDFGDERLALAAYNAGPGRVRETIDRVGDPRTGQVTWNGFMAALPSETRDYVKNISGNGQDEGIKVPEWVKETGRVLDTGIKGGIKAVGTLGTTIGRGAEQIARFPLEAGAEAAGTSVDELLAPLQEYLPSKTPAQLAQEGVEYVTRPIEQPQTQTGQMASNVISSTVAGALTPGVGPAVGAVQGLGAGVGAEGAAQVLGESPFNRAIGSLAGGGIVAGGQAILPNAAKARLGEEVTKDMNDYGLEIAKNNMKEAAKFGVTLRLDQAYPTATNSQKLAEVFANMKGGEKLADQIRQQPEQIANAAKNLQRSLPGEVLPASQVNANAQKQATDVLQQDFDWRKTEVQPYFAASGQLSPQHAKAIIEDVHNLAIKHEGTTKGRYLADLEKDLMRTVPVIQNGIQVGTKQVPKRDIQSIQDTLASAENSTAGINVKSGSADKETIGLLGKVANDIRQGMAQVSEPYAKGNKLYGQISEALNNPNRASAIGAIAGPNGYNSAQASPEIINSVFNKGTPIDPKTGKATYSDILGLQSQLARTGKDGKKAFADAGVSWLGEKLGKAIGTSTSQAPRDVSKRIKSELFPDDTSAQGLKDVVAGVAKSGGEDPKVFVDGLNTFIKTLEHAATNLPRVGGATTGGVKQVTGAPGVEQAGKFTVLQPFRQPMLYIQARLNSSAVDTVSQLMTTPEGIATLKKLAQARAGSTSAYKTLSQFSATLSQTDNPEESK